MFIFTPQKHYNCYLKCLSDISTLVLSWNWYLLILIVSAFVVVRFRLPNSISPFLVDGSCVKYVFRVFGSASWPVPCSAQWFSLRLEEFSFQSLCYTSLIFFHIYAVCCWVQDLCLFIHPIEEFPFPILSSLISFMDSPVGKDLLFLFLWPEIWVYLSLSLPCCYVALHHWGEMKERVKKNNRYYPL